MKGIDPGEVYIDVHVEGLGDHFAEGAAVAVFRPPVGADVAQPPFRGEERQAFFVEGDI